MLGGCLTLRNEFAGIIIRKLLTTFITVTISSIVLASMYVTESTSIYNLGNHLIQGSLFYGIYIGAIVLVYGNAVSIALEYIQRKWLNYPNGVFILLHGLFGLANGLLFQVIGFAWSGMVVALLYAIIDRWLLKRMSGGKSLKAFLIVSVLIYGLSWGMLQITSPSLPPFTKEDAVNFATSGKGTVTDLFPKEIAKKVDNISGYTVSRETKVEESERGVYIVTFVESWSSEEDSGEWYASYKVKRGQLSAYGGGGTEPPYR